MRQRDLDKLEKIAYNNSSIMSKNELDWIRVFGARENNLKNIDVAIPRDKFVVITGLSGSGKSSLAFDTIYAEGQRRYVESLSSYARQFLGQMEKPKVDHITGLSPAISIDQKSTSRNPRSTVATATEIYDYLRLLFARLGVPHCPICGKIVAKRSPQNIVDEILKMAGEKIYIAAPIAKQKKGEFQHIPAQFLSKGFARARVDGVIFALDEWPELDKNFKHDIELIVDRLVVNDEQISRISQSVEAALEIAGGNLEIIIVRENSPQNLAQNSAAKIAENRAENSEKNPQNLAQNSQENREIIKNFSTKYACVDHPDELIPELEPRLFSFNSPFGACPDCSGLGYKLEIDPELILNQNLTILEGAILPYNRIGEQTWRMRIFEQVAARHGFSLKIPAKNLSSDATQKILYGTGDEKYQMRLNDGRPYQGKFEGVIPNLERRWRETDSEFMRREIERFMRERECATCHGARLKPVVLAVTVHDLNINDVANLSVADALEIFSGMDWSDQEKTIGEQIFKEIISRLQFMADVGLDYLELGRAANTLSGGEAQRIRLATQIGSGLQGVLYVLDEPSIGLHQKDNDQLIATLKHLRDLGNTVLVVEHDEDTICAADYLIDIGPGAGVRGGNLVAAGTPDEVAKNPDSLTGQYLSGRKKIATPKNRRKIDQKRQLIVRGATEHNLKNIDAKFPLGVMNVVTGVSGSGKSTLVNDILAKGLAAKLNRAKTSAGAHKAIEGVEFLDKVITIDQSPIGRTPRSNVATYTGIFSSIRELFASTPESNIRGYKMGRFSFNVRGGRCETCQGDGVIKIEMHFLPDVFVSCPECGGARYTREVLEIKYKGKNISEVLEMTVAEAVEFFDAIPKIAQKLRTISEVGLDYIKLGQPATTFSGGEAQRIKLATELSKRATGKTLYILDEPTTGLHSDDVGRLLDVMKKLVDAGNSMIVIEHNLDVIKNADHVIDLGPRGGIGGGRIVANGTPEEIAQNPASETGKYLAKILAQ